uniref:Uncharacterized protein n=1 Tax=Timema bartmani TaxID=61472 RepID=A0A7R9I284_9NEOP|nr:unnamed protein product [Timema bartmani]
MYEENPNFTNDYIFDYARTKIVIQHRWSHDITQWSQTQTFEADNTTVTCTPKDSDEFPGDIFTTEQKEHGAIILHIIGGIYAFTMIALICRDYFLPSVHCICEALDAPTLCGSVRFQYPAV